MDATMGRWCYVNCNCRPAYPNISWEEHLRTHRSDTPSCIHADWELVGFWPGLLLHIAETVRKLAKDLELNVSFAVFDLIGSFDRWPEEPDKEILFLTTKQRDEWELELEELLKWNANKLPYPDAAVRKWRKHVEHKFASQAEVTEALIQALHLCKASREMGNPVVFAV
jgi:hypothetical protein